MKDLTTSANQIPEINEDYENVGHSRAGRQVAYLQEDEDDLNMNEINLKEKTDDRIIFRKIPFPLWIIGSIVFITSLYLLYTLALGYFGVLYKGPK